MLAQVLGKVTNRSGFPSELVPMTVVRMFSSSAATGLLLDLFKQYGTRFPYEVIASVMMSCTETIFYTMSVYFVAARVTEDPLCASAGALLSTFAGIAASVILAA